MSLFGIAGVLRGLPLNSSEASMAIPAEFSAYISEDDFIQRFIIPLLRRLGFSVVVNYHGKREFGKDLIFGEIDRFGHIRYHAMQVKLVASIGLTMSKEIIEDAEQAFANPFTHPHKKEQQYISTFYAVNGGSISDEATDNYFNRLMKYAGNTRLLDGKALIELDRYAAVNRSAGVSDMMRGLLLEYDSNINSLLNLRVMLLEYIADYEKPLPLNRIRDDALSQFLLQPYTSDQNIVHKALRLSQFFRTFNTTMDFCLFSLGNKENKKEQIVQIETSIDTAIRMIKELATHGTEFLLSLEPLTSL